MGWRGVLLNHWLGKKCFDFPLNLKKICFAVTLFLQFLRGLWQMICNKITFDHSNITTVQDHHSRVWPGCGYTWRREVGIAVDDCHVFCVCIKIGVEIWVLLPCIAFPSPIWACCIFARFTFVFNVIGVTRFKFPSIVPVVWSSILSSSRITISPLDFHDCRGQKSFERVEAASKSNPFQGEYYIHFSRVPICLWLFTNEFYRCSCVWNIVI